MLLADIWSVGCIFGEMLRGAVVFPGVDRMILDYKLFHFTLVKSKFKSKKILTSGIRSSNNWVRRVRNS